MFFITNFNHTQQSSGSLSSLLTYLLSYFNPNYARKH